MIRYAADARAEARSLPHPQLLGALMLGAALSILPLGGHAQTASTAPSTAPAADAAAPVPAPVPNANPAATDAAGGSGTVTTTPAPAADAAPAGAAADAKAAETTAAGAAGSGAPAKGETAKAGADTQQAAAVIKSADGKEMGSVTLSDTPSGYLYAIVHLEGLPNGLHGIHIHETGKCEGPSFESAGGHLAGGHTHGIMDADGIHKGDLPNVDGGDSGTVNQDFFMADVKLSDVMDDDGGAFIVHSAADDYTSQPSGNSGDRIACGVFTATKGN